MAKYRNPNPATKATQCWLWPMADVPGTVPHFVARHFKAGVAAKGELGGPVLIFVCGGSRRVAVIARSRNYIPTLEGSLIKLLGKRRVPGLTEAAGDNLVLADGPAGSGSD